MSRPPSCAPRTDARLPYTPLFRSAWARTRDDKIGLGAYASRGLGTERLRLGFCLVAAHRLELAGEDHGHARHLARPRFDDIERRRDFGEEVVPQVAVVRFVEEIGERLGDGGADAISANFRSEERRVGKECVGPWRSRGAPY